MTLPDTRPLWTRDFLLLFLANFFLYLGTFLLTPVLPVHLAQAGISNFEIGLVLGCFTLASIFLRFFAAKITGYIPPRVFLMGSLLVCSLATGGYAATTGILFLLSIRILHGFGFGAGTTLSGAMVSDIVPLPRMGEGIGYFGLGLVMASAIGPFLGATIVLTPQYQWVFLLSSGMLLISLLLTKASHAGRHGKKKFPAPFSITDAYEKKALFPGVLTFFIGFSMAGVYIFIVLFGKEAGVEKGAGAFFVVNAIAEFTARAVSGKIYDRRGPVVVLLSGGIVTLAGLLLLSGATTIPVFLAASFLYGLGLGAVLPVLQAWSMRAAAPDRRVAATATFYNFLDAGVALGAVLLGLVAEASTFSRMYLCTAIAPALFLAIYVLSLKRQANDAGASAH